MQLERGALILLRSTTICQEENCLGKYKCLLPFNSSFCPASFLFILLFFLKVLSNFYKNALFMWVFRELGKKCWMYQNKETLACLFPLIIQQSKAVFSTAFFKREILPPHICHWRNIWVPITKLMTKVLLSPPRWVHSWAADWILFSAFRAALFLLGPQLLPREWKRTC